MVRTAGRWLAFGLVLSACGQQERETAEQTGEFRSACWGASCCPAGTNVIQGTSSVDTIVGTTSTDCLVGLAGDDTITTQSGGDTVFGGLGNDVLTGGGLVDKLFGHAGNDTLTGNNGGDKLVPGPGLDTVSAGGGDDFIILHSLCEIVSGETIDGGLGTDKLTTPWSLADLTTAGLSVSNVETINVVPQNFEYVECCDTDVCGEHGTCGEASGVVTCACDTGYTGRRCRWNEDDILAEFDGLSDPTAWSVDATSGLYYRRATAYEMDANGWYPGTYLVETDTLTSTLETGPSTVSLVLPMTDTTVGQLDLDLLGSDSEALFIEVTAGASTTAEVATTYPTFYFYGSSFRVVNDERELDGALVTLTAIDEDGTFRGSGHFERTGLVATAVNAVKLSRPSPHAMMEVVSGASLGISDVHLVQWSPSPAEGDWPPTNPGDYCGLFGGDYCDQNDPDCHPCAEPHEPTPALTQCTDTLDNDGDDDIDIDGPGATEPDTVCVHGENCDPTGYNSTYPAHTHNRETGKYYAIFGDVVHCTVNSHDWPLRAHDRALFMRQTFHAETPNAAYNAFVDQPGVDAVRWFASKCWIMESAAEARDCRRNGNCGLFNSGDHVYPYANLGSARDYFVNYIWATRADYQHAVELDYPYNSIEYPADFVHLMVHHGQDDYYGVDTEWGGKTNDDDHFGAIINGAREDLVGDPIMAWRSSPHETGHLFGCSHCDAEYANGTWDVMTTTNDEDNPMCEHNVSHLNAGIWFNGECAGNLLSGLNFSTSPSGDGPHFGF